MVDLKSFDLNLLRVLEALLSEAQVSAAARRLNLSQPAASAALARLRAALGDPLLVRSGSRMLRTALAEDILPKISALLAGIETALNPPRAFHPATSNRIFRIAANDYAAEVVLSVLVERLRRTGPDLTLEILPLDENFAKRLAIADYDLAIRDHWSMRSARHIETLYEEDYVGIARHDHPRLSPKPTLEEFVTESHVLISSQGRTQGPVDSALARLKRERRVAVTLPHFLVAPTLVAKTDLVMTIARRVALRFAGQHALRVFDVPLPLRGFSVAMAWHPKSIGDPAVEWLKGEIRALVKAPASSTFSSG